MVEKISVKLNITTDNDITDMGEKYIICKLVLMRPLFFLVCRYHGKFKPAENCDQCYCSIIDILLSFFINFCISLYFLF